MRDARAMWLLFNFAALILRSALAVIRSRGEQAIVELALRQQLATCLQKRSKPPLTPLDRAFWVALSRPNAAQIAMLTRRMPDFGDRRPALRLVG